jgi:uncharacterized phage protein (TIGR01671 family)
MREIIFRARTRGGKGNRFGVREDGSTCKEHLVEQLNHHNFRLETVGLFTGMLDSNGRKIFEGDILEITSDLVEVCWSDDRAAFWGRYLSDREWDYLYTINENHGHNWEVVGSIHLNPELMEETNDA